MPETPFSDVITSAENLRAIMGTPSDLVIRKQLDRLDRHARNFIGRSPFLLMGTSGADQLGDVSPRGDAPGFVAVLDDTTAQGKRPLVAIGVEVKECFFHCAKAFKRSHLWQPDSWPARDGMASLAQILMDQVQPSGTSVEALESQIAESYATRLY